MGQQGQQGQYDNTNRFVLFPNKHKDKSDPSHERKPDYTGKINVNGVDHWLNGWVKRPNNGGASFLSGTLGDPCDAPKGGGGGGGGQAGKYRKPAGPPAQNPIGDQPQFKEDDIPF